MMAQIQHDKDKLNLSPKKFVMWLIIFASFMMFAAWTSGFIVYAGGKKLGLDITLPPVFLYSTFTIALSSITMFMASRAAKRMQLGTQRMFLWFTIVLGIAFFALQVNGWKALVDMQAYLVNNNALQSFIYILTGMHLLHIVAGLILIGYALAGSYRNIPQVKNLFRMDITAIFWHFVDIIWIYLYVFLLLNQK